eukprot:COSAG01_NODE_30211_length_620_cov_3.224568_1_plen_91_part_00
MTGAQRRISKGGHPGGPNKKKRSDAGTTGVRKKRSDAGTTGVRKKRRKEVKKRRPYNTKKKELLAAQARANNNKISDAFGKAKLAKKKGH